MHWRTRLHRSRNEAERIKRRRETDPAWWQDYLARNAAYRRDRAARDSEYRHLRNAQAK